MTNEWPAGQLRENDDSDAPLVDEALEWGKSPNDDFQSPHRQKVYDELAAMRAEIDSVKDSLQLLAERASRLARVAPSVIEEELNSFIQRRPLAALIGTTLLSYVFTRRFLR